MTRKSIQDCCYKCERRKPLCWSDCEDYAKRKADDAKRRESLRMSEAEMYAISTSVKIKDRKRRKK